MGSQQYMLHWKSEFEGNIAFFSLLSSFIILPQIHAVHMNTHIPQIHTLNSAKKFNSHTIRNRAKYVSSLIERWLQMNGQF